jgi:flagella basal body P-ring formation protein FlgA
MMMRSLCFLLVLGSASIAGAKPLPDWSRSVDWGLSSELEVTELRLSAKTTFSPEAEIRAVWDRPATAGRRSVRLKVKEGASSRDIWAVVHIEWVVTVLVATRDLHEGDTLRAEDLRTERRVRSAAGPKPLTAVEALLGRRLANSVSASEAFEERDLERLPALPRGAEVRVQAGAHGLSVWAEGTLEQSLRPGERGRVRLVSSKRVVMGVLDSDGAIVLEEQQ